MQNKTTLLIGVCIFLALLIMMSAAGIAFTKWAYAPSDTMMRQYADGEIGNRNSKYVKLKRAKNGK